MARVPLLHLRRGPTSLGIPTTLTDCEPSYSCQIRRLRLAPSESSHGRKRAKLSVLSPMSAFGPKRTFPYVAFDVAFGGKAGMAFCGMSLSRSLLGVKQTCHFALQLHMSASDPSG